MLVSDNPLVKWYSVFDLASFAQIIEGEIVSVLSLIFKTAIKLF